MKKILFLFLGALLSTMTAWATEGDVFAVGNLKYRVTSESQQTVEFVGFTTDPSGALEIPATVSYKGKDYSMTGIFIYAFSDKDVIHTGTLHDSDELTCDGITSIALPSTMSDMVGNVFVYCRNETSITVDPGNAKYSSKDGVLFDNSGKTLIAYPSGRNEASYTIPDGVTDIDHQAFCGNLNLKSVTIPASVSTFRGGCFNGCTGLTSVVFAAGSQLKSIGNDSFWNCMNLSSITIPDGVTSIGNFAFYGCGGLASITIPASVTSLGENPFYYCEVLAHIYCYANPETLTWTDNVTRPAKSKSTRCHVKGDVKVWETKFPTVNVTFVGDLDHYETGIKSLAPDTPDGAWYTLDGMKLEGEPTTPGVYVKDGKKMIIK